MATSSKYVKILRLKLIKGTGTADGQNLFLRWVRRLSGLTDRISESGTPKEKRIWGSNEQPSLESGRPKIPRSAAAHFPSVYSLWLRLTLIIFV